jgi:predicted DNA-binding antitoxin AbrB/MazE fold protein
MTQVLKAIFDGKVFRPEEPVKFPAHSSVEIVVRSPKTKSKSAPYSSLKLAASLKLKGPKDFSENLDEYLYRNKPFK